VAFATVRQLKCQAAAQALPSRELIANTTSMHANVNTAVNRSRSRLGSISQLLVYNLQGGDGSRWVHSMHAFLWKAKQVTPVAAACVMDFDMPFNAILAVL